MGGAISRVCAIIVNYRTPDLTKRCVEALEAEKNSLPNLTVIVVDGHSMDDSVEILAAFCSSPKRNEWVRFLPLPINGGFGWANNQAILIAAKETPAPEFIYLINPDATVEPNAVVSLAAYLNAHAEVAAVGSQMLNSDGTTSGSAFNFPTVRGEFGRAARTGLVEKVLRIPPISVAATQARYVDWVTGGSVMLRLSALREVGLFDEGFFLYNEEVELMWRLKKHGWRVATEPSSRVLHMGGAATGVGGVNPDVKLGKRLPRYIFRSRSRFFGLTRGLEGATAAYLAWTAGNLFWWMRRFLGLAKGAPIDHQLRDHLRAAFPRIHDAEPSIATLASHPGQPPAWMINRWQ